MTAASVRDLIERRRSGWVARGLAGPTSDELRALCKDARWAFVEVRLGRVEDKADLMRTLARQLDLPEYFGGNWDAVEECLGDVVARAGGLVLRVKGLGTLPAGLSEPLVDILDDLVAAAPGAEESEPDAHEEAEVETSAQLLAAPLVVVADPPLPR